MNPEILFLIGLFAVPAIFTAKFVINMRKKLMNAEESKQHLQAGLEAKLKAEERKRQVLEENLIKNEEERKCLENQLKQKVENEVELCLILQRKEQQQVAEKEAYEKRKKEKLEQFEDDRRQFEEKLLQAEEEKKHLIDKLQKAERERDRLEGEQPKFLQELENRWQAEREALIRVEKERNEKMETQRQELEERIHQANQERDCLKETIRQTVKDVNELLKKHLMQEQQWRSKIEVLNKAQKEMKEKFDTERRNLEENLLNVEERRIRLEEEIKQEVEEKEELRKALNQKINQLEVEGQQLKETLFETQKEYKRLEEESKQGLNQQELGRLEGELQQLRVKLSKSKERRKRLVNRLRVIRPIDRGGRSRGPVKEKGVNGLQEERTQSLKPEIICWKEGWTWIIGIELAEGLESESISQDGIQLECDIAGGNRYPLKKMGSRIEITWSGGSETIALLRPDRNYLIFKMRNSWKEPGRLVQYSTAGYYLIVAPQDCERDIDVSGSAIVTPESTQIEGLKAHFFYQEKTKIAGIGLITADGKRVLVDSKSPRFKLVGQEVYDNSEDKGPLFAEKPPLIQALDETKGWNDVGVIVVGEEGTGSNRWRDSFVPDMSVQEQKAIDELINGRSGWYFIRIYDKDNHLIESMDFRFSKNLQGIQIEGGISCFPDLNGYESTIVRFLHHPDCKFELIDKDKEHLLEILRENGQTTVTVPPNPNCDKTDWILNDCGVEIEVSILVERIWWSCGTLEAMPNIWMDKPAQLFRKDFIATTDKALWVKLPRPLFARKIYGGFDRTKSRFYQVEVEKKEVAIPLRDFCDCEEILNSKQACLFQLFIDSPNRAESTPVISIITSFSCKYCQFITSSEQGALSHISSHVTDLIQHLTYDELWHRSGGSLPRIIYRCAYCSFYVKTSDIENPTSTICSHIEHDHKKATHEFGKGKIYFSVVTDIEEIRKNVLTNLPHIYRCKLCGKEFHGNNRGTMLNHLQVIHRDKLFKYL